ncbi:MAG: hypothetical protein WCS92_04000 [Candidatus Babeliales bacterium]
MELKFKNIAAIFCVVVMLLLNQIFATVAFDNEISRFILKDSNSKIKLNPAAVYGWRDRSLIKNITGGGLSDYNIKSYSGVDDIVTYAEAPGELVYDNSNAIIKLDRDLRTDSNAFAYGIKNNSNTLLALNRTTSNALLFGDRNNSNAIVTLDQTVRTDSNAFAYEIKNNSNAILVLQFDDLLTHQNSNAIVKLDQAVRTDSNAFAYEIKNNSNAILVLQFDDLLTHQNSNAIVKLDQAVRTDSNAFAYGIKNNSNAIITLNNTAGTLSINNSNAIVSWIKGTSNAVNSTFNPPLVSGNIYNNIVMNETIILDSNQVVNITNTAGVVLDGNGQTIIFNNSSGPQFVVQENVSVILENITLGNINQDTFNIKPGGQLLIGPNTTFEFSENVTFSSGTFDIMDSPDGTVCTFVSLSGNNVVTFVDEAVLNLGNNTLRLEDIELGGVLNIDYGASNLIELATGASVDIDGDTGEAIGLNFKAIGQDNALTLMMDNLTLSGLITFGDAAVNELAIRFVLLDGLDPDRVAAGEIYPIVNFTGGPGIMLGGSPINDARLTIENPYTIFNLLDSNAFLLDQNGQIIFNELEIRENNIKQYSASVLVDGIRIIGHQIDPSFIRAYSNHKPIATNKTTSKLKAKIQIQPKTAKVKVEKSNASDSSNVSSKVKNSTKNAKINFKDKKLKIKQISAKNRKGVEALDDILGTENLDEALSDNILEL